MTSQPNLPNTIPTFLRGVTIVEVLVVLVSAVGLFFFPATARELWAWSPAPFNARNLGAIFFTALLPLTVLACSGRWAHGRVVVWMIFSFTASVMVAMLAHWEAFAWERIGAWGFWFLYLFLPVNSAVYLYRLRRWPLPGSQAPDDTTRWLLLGAAGTAGAYGLALLATPSGASAFWPWPVDVFHARMYASAFIAPAVAAFVLVRRCTAAELLILGAALAVFGTMSLAGMSWTHLAAPVERQVDFTTPGTALFVLMQTLLIGWGGALMARAAARGAMPALPDRTLRWFALGMGVAFVMAAVGGFVPGLTLPPLPGAPVLEVELCYGRLLGLFPVNAVHNVFHLLVGVAGIWASRSDARSLRFAQIVAIALAALTLMGLGAPWHSVFGLMPVYGHAVWLHGLEALAAAYLGFVVGPTWLSLTVRSQPTDRKKRSMKPGMGLQRAYLFVVMWFTLFVGSISFFRPQEILKELPWPMPPLHARFVGALYLAATVMVVLAMLARTRLQARTVVDIAFVWTGWLLLITAIQWSSFDLSRMQVWFWVGAYIAFPAVALWLSRASDPVTAAPDIRIREAWVPRFLATLGVGLIGLAAVLFLLPASAAGFWPWKISMFLAQVYSGPVLGLGVGCLLLAVRRNWPETLFPMLGVASFSLLALIASSWHLDLFSPGSPSMFAWFGILSILALMSIVLVVGSMRLGFDREPSAGTLISGAP